MEIDKTAIVSSEAKLGKNVKIGPFSTIDKNVTIGDGTKIGPNCHITGWTEIGKNCDILHGVVVGNPPQDVKFKGKRSFCVIGDGNMIREYVTIHRGSDYESKTVIGSSNFLMAYSHVGHNCNLGNGVILANAANLSGYVEVEDFAFISGLVPVHQFVRIGCYCMIGGGYRVPKDIVPYSLAGGYPIRICGLNTVGLKRHKFKAEIRNILKEAYKIIFFSNLNTHQAIARAKTDLPQREEVKHLIEFIENSTRGIVK